MEGISQWPTLWCTEICSFWVWGSSVSKLHLDWLNKSWLNGKLNEPLNDLLCPIWTVQMEMLLCNLCSNTYNCVKLTILQLEMNIQRAIISPMMIANSELLQNTCYNRCDTYHLSNKLLIRVIKCWSKCCSAAKASVPSQSMQADPHMLIRKLQWAHDTLTYPGWQIYSPK